MINHAMALARMGFRVFPVFPIISEKKYTKVPALLSWQDLATTDEATLQHWWSGTCQVTNKKDRTWTIPNNSAIGILTTDYIVIDVDVKHVDAAGSLNTLIKNLALPKTLVNVTPTGGRHLIYSTPAPVQNRTKWYPGIDIRGDRGYIVGPGSMRDGEPYHWHDVTVPIAPAPAALVVALTVPSPAPQAQQSNPNADFGTGADYSKFPNLIPSGSRDDTVFRYTCSWRERNMSIDQAQALMRVLFERIEQVPGDEFTWDDAVAKIDQAWAAYKPGGARDIAVTTLPTEPYKSTRAAATLKEALDYFILIEEGTMVADTRRRPDKAVMTLTEFRASMKPDKAGGDELVPAWLRSPYRRTVRDMSYFPQKNLPVFNLDGTDYFNVYYGPSFEVPSEPNPDLIKLFMDHMTFLFPNRVSRELMLDWMAFTVQYPHLRIPWCYLFVTINEGLGKGLLYALMSRCVGQHNASLVQPDDLTEKGGTYNGYMSHVVLVCFDEIKARAVDYERLRLLITSPELMINHKYGKKSMERIFANTWAFSNHLNAISISQFDRRFFVDCNYNKPKDKYYYDHLWIAVEGELPAHWLAFLKKRDVSRFAWNSAPLETDAKKLMQGGGKNAVETLILDCIEERIGPFQCDIICASIARDYISSIGSRYGIDTESIVTYQMVANVITNICPSLPQEKYLIPQSETAKVPARIRCKCIRRYDYWSKQPKEAIVSEYERARMISLGVKPEKALVSVDTKKGVK